MSFQNENSKKNNKKIDAKKVPFVEENCNELLSNLQSTFFEFNKNLEDLKDYNNDLNDMAKNQFNTIKDEMHKKITTFPESISNISNIINRINQTDIKDLVIRVNKENRIKEQVKIVNDKMQTKKVELDKVLMEIIDKEKLLSKKKTIREQNPQVDFNKKPISVMPSFRDSKLITHEIMENEDYLNKRLKQLEDIKKVSSQVKELSNLMTTDVMKQGKDIDQLEEITVEAKTNAEKGEENIMEAEKITSGDNKRICTISIIILFSAICILVLVFFVFLR